MALVSFRARACTIDHLGREQISDCPTAVSELWKNAYDAYARSVALHIFDGEVPVVAVVDHGHGMSRQEIQERWLVVGTEAKTETRRSRWRTAAGWTRNASVRARKVSGGSAQLSWVL